MINKMTIKQKVYIISAFAIIWLIILSFVSFSSTNKVLKNFTDMNRKELWIKNTVQSIATNISELNRLIVTTSLADEVTKDTIADVKDFNEDIQIDINSLKKYAHKHNDKKLEKIMNNISIRYNSYYKMALNLPQLFKDDLDDGIDGVLGMTAISDKMNDEITTLLFNSDKNFNKRMQLIGKTMNQSKNIINYVSVIAILLFLLFSYMFVKSIVESLNNLDKGVDDLLNSDQVKTLDIKIKDEVGKITEKFNQYISKIEKNLIEDKKFIDEAKSIIDRLKIGNFDKTIEAHSSNIVLEEFKDSVNDMIIETKRHYEEISYVLAKYANLDYTQELQLDGIASDGIYDILSKDINILKDTITSMLIESKKSGILLEQNATVLLSNVQSLNNNSNKAAAALEQTSAALEEITSNIRSNGENIAKMSNYATELNQSSHQGQQYATQTATAMTDIDKQVRSINEAITVIDQIAFQTNILSLNAAVEAATAGEAGKGFAVVAQEVRNLASRSAEAANEIKSIVETATQKANDGKNISDKMIEGYQLLNENITKTSQIISDVQTASNEQLLGIEQINNAVTHLDSQTQQNVVTANKTQEIAITTSTMAENIVEEVSKKKFNE
jgi:methyl-accepting chemotaxis protein